MKNKILLALLPFALAASYSSATYAIPITTELQIGNSTLFISGPALNNRATPLASGSDFALDRPTPVAPSQPEIYTLFVENVWFDSPLVFTPGPDVAPGLLGSDIVNFSRPDTLAVAAPAAIPEPSILLLAGLGLTALGLRQHRR